MKTCLGKASDAEFGDRCGPGCSARNWPAILLLLVAAWQPDASMGQLLDSVDDPLDMIELIPAESIPAQELQMPGSFGEQIGQPGLHLQVQPEPIDWIGLHGPHPEALIIEDPRKLRRQRLADCLRHPCRCLAFTLHDLLLPPNTRHRGIGKPLLRESWRYRPFHAGWFMGPLQGSPLIDDWVGGSNGFLAGYRFGWDYDHYWGCELRFAFGNVALYDSQRAKDAQTAADNANNIPVDDPFRDRFETRRDLTGSFWDVSILNVE